jgi:PAS domain S-box-containing protein
MSDANDTESGGMSLDAFDLAPVGVAATSGPDHRLIYYNSAHREITGERTLGLPIREAYPDLRQHEYFSWLDQVLATGEAITRREVPFEFCEHGRPERARRCSISMSKISPPIGEEGVLIMSIEVTEQVDTAQVIDSIAKSRRRYLQRYQSLLQIETQVVWVAGARGETMEPSPGWQRLTGQSWEEYRGDGWQQAVHPDDLSEVLADWAVARDRLSLVDHVYRLRMADGTYRHSRSRAIPVLEGRTAIEWVGTCADIEQEWQEARNRELLDRAAAATADIAGLDEVLGMLTRVIVPDLADGCGVYLLPEFEDHSIPLPFTAERVVSTKRDGLLMDQPLRTESFESNSGFVEAVRTRRPIRYTFPPGAPPPDVPPVGTEDWFVASEANSMALVPVIVDGTVAAMVAAVVCGSREPLNASDMGLLGRMLDHAHAHLSNAMRFQRTQRVALALQHYLLPDPPDVPGLEIVARYRPSARAVEIGGDWYDSFVLPDGATILTIGDVAGHDLTAAVTMSQLRNMLRGLAMDRREPPGDILRRLNIATEALYPEGTATCILARLEGPNHGSWQLRYSVAGHPPPLLVTRDGEGRYLNDAVNPLLGVTYDQPRRSAVAALPPRGTLLFYTDGLVELPGEHLDVGLERLRRHAASLARAPLEVFSDQLLARMPLAKKDDIAMIAVRLPELGRPGRPCRPEPPVRRPGTPDHTPA